MKFIGKSSGKSMLPIINPGDKLFIEETNIKSLKIGEIIVFYDKGKLISHRIIKKRNGRIIAKGDNSPFPDKKMISNEIFGRVVKITGKKGYIDLRTQKANLLKYVFLFYSVISGYLPLLVYKILTKILRGRKFMVEVMKERSNDN
ncbi:MAG: Signal peptidase I [Candidatus Roizmanbacteria bacterium GW2011_GWA2_37_7]|uniref:Signal peptidase I n=1 Tax=Candidatus Roizmanbacteria bacterium GW2011_GWA2_37_7 TaxID=1618481 RepID=A0A0G0H2H4_9BACT|nr:MAG: Signal peptidase I [Candidatus Roizmanbacteria bacterium GW2011_GWA2_37_7]